MPHIKEEQYTLVIHFVLDSSGIPHLDKANVMEVYYEEPKEEKKDDDKKEEKKEEEKKDDKPDEKKNKKERSTVCIVKTSESIFGLPQNILDVI
jgi:hypothetical protein